MSGMASMGSSASVLWIDDEVRSDDPSVQLLESEGFEILTAASARQGLECAATLRFSAILLDLRLPDLSGLEIIPELRRVSGDTAIAVLTGFANLDVAVEAAKLGAARVCSKPLWGDELSGVVAGLMQGTSLRSPRRQSGKDSVVDALVRASQSTYGREMALTVLARELADPTMSTFAFGVCSVAFRRLIRADAVGCIAAIEALRERMSEAQTGLGRRVSAILASLEHAGPCASAASIAAAARVPPSVMTQELRMASGLPFRAWKTLLRVRPSVSYVVGSSEQIAQIAYRCGYEHPGQLDRDFARCFGMSPRLLRETAGTSSCANRL
jgi:ActR/RegA family two-component response regulator/AraC-like DNA-binding protein